MEAENDCRVGSRLTDSWAIGLGSEESKTHPHKNRDEFILAGGGARAYCIALCMCVYLMVVALGICPAGLCMLECGRQLS